HLPLSQMLARFDLLTDRYELLLDRQLLEPTGTPGETAHETAIRGTLAEARDMVVGADKLIETAIGDARNSIEDRVALARVQGNLGHLLRDLGPYGKIGDTALEVYHARGTAEAAKVVQDISYYDDSFRNDTGAITQALGRLTQRAIDTSIAQQNRELLLD